ncbi:fatty acid hydroxylase family protein [Myxococcus sp. K15C18031901]|uniref:fatty acid hydroxylase family protein n=1 Tax=Myxococcus dinghuensis TaxID=2906761 RepID=UPI0020A71E41|nr:fatty acid hydroxylase family protein [Myxococcus dinghuensis]MCP3104093.1 fatty acid hydroxylase family protein [Myxococcus dinghuensis]
MNERAVPQGVARFREEYRRRHVGPRYSGVAHFAFTSGVSLSAIAFALGRLEAVRPLEWLTVPAVFLLGNLVEFLGHRGPMHHRKLGLGLLFQRHTEQHHRFFTHEALAYESHRDVKMVLFPPVLLLFFLGAIATPLGALAYWWVSPEVGWLFAASAVGYYLSYEWLHFCHHLPPTNPVARLPGMARLRRHHQAHHDPSLMQRYHFNITVPLGDWLFGTLHRPELPVDAKPRPAPMERGEGA